MTINQILDRYDRATIASGIDVFNRLLAEGASWSDARAQANEFMRLRFESREQIAETARVFAGQPAHVSSRVH
jgi:hypothetical protein